VADEDVISTAEKLFKQHLPDVIQELVKISKDNARREVQSEAIKVFLAYAMDKEAFGQLLGEFEEEEV
jgi:hypothetical protein